MTRLTSVPAPHRWRSVAAVVMVLGLLLPMTRCTGPEPHRYDYAYDHTLEVFDECRNPPEGTGRVECYGEAALFDVLHFAPFVWPLLGAAVALRARRRITTVLRLAAELLLMGGSAYWFWAELVFNDPLSGWYVETAGLCLYFAAWTAEIAKQLNAVRARRRSADTS